MSVIDGGRIFRVIIGAVLVAGLINAAASLGLSSQLRPFVIHETPTLAGGIGEHHALEQEFRFYTDLRSVGAGRTLTLPPGYPLDIDALASISLVTVAEHRTDERSAGLPPVPPPEPALTGDVHLVTDSYCVIVPYRIDHAPAQNADLQVWFEGRDLVVGSAFITIAQSGRSDE